MWLFSAARAVFRKVSRAVTRTISTVRNFLAPITRRVVAVATAAVSTVRTILEPVGRRLGQLVVSGIAAVRRFCVAHPWVSRAIGVILIGVGVYGLVHSLLLLTLPVIGFAVLGVVAGKFTSSYPNAN
jgi:hypothetical protein